MASEEGCGTTTEPIVVDGADGTIGADDCNVAVVTTAGRGYWIQLYTSGDEPRAVAPTTGHGSRSPRHGATAPEDAVD